VIYSDNVYGSFGTSFNYYVTFDKVYTYNYTNHVNISVHFRFTGRSGSIA